MGRSSTAGTTTSVTVLQRGGGDNSSTSRRIIQETIQGTRRSLDCLEEETATAPPPVWSSERTARAALRGTLTTAVAVRETPRGEYLHLGGGNVRSTSTVPPQLTLARRMSTTGSLTSDASTQLLRGEIKTSSSSSRGEEWD